MKTMIAGITRNVVRGPIQAIGPELLDDPFFLTGEGWTSDVGQHTIEGGSVLIDRAGGVFGNHLKNVQSAVVGGRYLFVIDVMEVSHTLTIKSGGIDIAVNLSAPGIYSGVIVATGGTLTTTFSCGGSANATARLRSVTKARLA